MLSLFLITSAFASSFFERPFPDTVRDASSIVRGKIGKSEVRSARLPDGSVRIFTYYDVQVSEGFKGAPRTGSPIQIREMGGEKDGVSLQVSGTAQFSTGDDVVVMLGKPPEGEANTYPVDGMMMGRYSVEKGNDGKEYLEGPGLGSSLHPGLRNENSPVEKAAHVTLENLREIVRSQAKEPAPKPIPLVTASPTMPFLSAPTVPAAKTPEPPAEVLSAPAPEKTSSSPFRPLVLLLGVIVGVMWFLKSKKNRR